VLIYNFNVTPFTANGNYLNNTSNSNNSNSTQNSIDVNANEKSTASNNNNNSNQTNLQLSSSTNNGSNSTNMNGAPKVQREKSNRGGHMGGGMNRNKPPPAKPTNPINENLKGEKLVNGSS
jgi:hypothetical protein